MPQTFLTPIFIFIAVVFCFVVLFVGDFSLFFLAALTPPLLLSCARIDLWVMGILAIHLSTLRFPGLPGQIVLCHIMILIMFVLTVLRNLTTHSTPRITWCKLWAFCFAILMVVLMWQRGSGFRLLGSNMWGGSAYIHLITSAVFYVFTDQVFFTVRTWRRIFVLMFSLAILPAVGESVLILSGGSVTWHMLFMLPQNTSVDFLAGETGNMLTRFQSLMAFTPVFMLPFLLFPFAGKYRKWFFVAVIGVIALTGLSGHRMVLVLVGLTVWLYIYFQVRNKAAYVLFSFMLLTVGLLILGQLAFLLPKSHQRMLSVIPFADIADDVSLNAISTVEWRIEVWREAIKMIPQYLWLGKGFAFEADAFLSQAAQYSEAYATRWAIVQTAFHQGILSLLVGTGIPGLVAGLGFLIGTFIRNLHLRRQAWTDAALRRMHLGIFSFFTAQTIIYIFIYGDAHISFPTLFIYATVLECLRQSDSSLTPPPDVNSAAQRPAFTPGSAAVAFPNTGGRL